MSNSCRSWKAVYALIVVAMVVIYSVAGGMMYWLFFDTTKPIEFIQARSEKPVYRRDDLITIHYEYNKTRDCPVEVVRTLTNEEGSMIIIGTLPGMMELDETTHTISFSFPNAMKNGVWTYYAIAHYRCNPLKTMRVKTPPVTFLVIEG